ncbi:MAG: hypothetical protein IJX13_05415, partial [Clostridia bacterium]|nr:hypothetical protein [Clostridia bacterium]
MKITHELTLDVSRQGIQATVPLTQNDAGIHRLRFALCNGGTPMIPSEGFYAMLYLPEGEVMDPVTLYTEAGACPGRLEYDVSPRVTAGTGKREAVLQIVDGEGKVLYSPHFAFVLAADPTGGSAVTSSPAYAAVIQAQTAAEKAAGRADEVAALAEQTAQEAEEAVATAKETLTEAVTASAEARRSAAEAEELVDSASGTVEEAKAVTAEARTLASALSASVSLAEARITNLEAAADGKLFLANRLQGTAVPNPAYDNPDEVLPTMLLTKLGDLSRSLGADQTYTLPTCVGSLFLSERFRTAYQPLCVGQSYFDLLEGQYLRYLQGRYVVTGEESAWCEPNGDTWSYYVTIPELSDLELGISLSLTGD